MTQDKKSDLNTIDLLVSTFLITYKDGIALNKLDQAYHGINGEYIPCAKYGFSNLHSLLTALPSVSLNGNWAKAIPTEKIKHIHKLVTEQKTTGKGHTARRPHNNQYRPNGNQWGGDYGGYNHQWYLPNNYNRCNGFGGGNYNNQYRPSNWSNHSNYGNSSFSRTAPTISRCTPRNQSANMNSVSTKDWKTKTAPVPLQVSCESKPKLTEAKTVKVEQPKMAVPLSEGAALRLKILFKRNFNGMSANQIIQKYGDIFPEYEADLDWKEMNQNCFEDLLNTAPNGLFSEAYSLSGHVMYFPGLLTTSSKILENPESTTGFPEETFSNGELATKDDTFPSLPLQQYLTDSKSMMVDMGEIYTPNRLYLMQVEDNTVNDLMEEIRTYLSEDRINKLRTSELYENMPVFVLHNDDDYYRAKVVDPSSDPVEIFIVDYGTTSYIKKENIFRIPKKFLQPHMQAFEATLDNVRPLKSNEWENDEAAAWLLENTPSKCTATITDRSQKTVKVVLNTTDSSESLNDRIVFSKLARNCVQPKPAIQMPLDILAASLKISQYDVQPRISTPVPSLPQMKMPQSVEIFSCEELFQIKNDMASPIVVPQLKYEAVAMLDHCLQSLIQQREKCLIVLSSNPEREDLFNYVQTLYCVIREMRLLKEF